MRAKLRMEICCITGHAMLVLFEGDRRHAGVADLQYLTWLDLRVHRRSIITWMLPFRFVPNKQSMNALQLVITAALHLH